MGKLKVAGVSTFRVPCGVAKEWERLAYELSSLVELKTYAEIIHSGSHEEEPINPNIALNYIRDWKRGKSFDKLYEDIIQGIPDLVHISYESAMYNEGMFSESLLLQLIRRLHEANIKTVITLHNVPEFQPTVYYAGWYNKLDSQIIVTNRLMERELLKWEPEARVTTIPPGSTIFTCIDKTEARTILNLPQDKYIITQVGFYGYDKGMLPLIEAMPKILSDIPNAYLVFAGSIHPLAPPIHRDYVKQCIKKAVELNLQNYVKFVGRFLTEEEITQYISVSDMLAINHQYVFGLYSSSASAHRVLASGKPTIMNSADVRLSEFRDGEHCVKVTNENLAEKIVSLSKDVGLQQRLYKGALEYANKTSFSEITKNHLSVYKSCVK